MRLIPHTQSSKIDGRTWIRILKSEKPRSLQIAFHKTPQTQLKSDRTSCDSAAANQFRRILQAAAYWLFWALRDTMPTSTPLKKAEFTTLQSRPIKLGARVIETATRIRVAPASACPDKALIATLNRALKPAPP